MTETRTHVRGPDEAPERLDRVLARSIPDISRSRLQALARAGHVAVDRVVSRDPSMKVPGGAELSVTIPPAVAAEPAGAQAPSASHAARARLTTKRSETRALALPRGLEPLFSP